MAGFDDYRIREPWFTRMSTLEYEEISQAGQRLFIPDVGMYAVRVVEPRPWGHLVWSVGTITFSDPVLFSIHVDSPYVEPSLMQRMRGALVEPLQRRLDDLPGPAGPHLRPNAHQRMHAGAERKKIASIDTQSSAFAIMLPIVAAMKDIEVAVARTQRGLNLANPAWFLLWNICNAGFSQFTSFDNPLLAAGYAAELALEQPPLKNSTQEIQAAWRDRSWWRPTKDPFSGSGAAVTASSQAMLSEANLSKRGTEQESGADAARPTASAQWSAPDLGSATKDDLVAARLVHQEVRDAFTAFCFDPHAVLARPLLNDVSDDLTAAFYVAQERADEAETDLEVRSNEAVAWAYRNAVNVLAAAWDAADIHARECGVSHLSSAEQNDVRRARRTLDLALNPSTPAGEREAAYRAVLALITGLVKIPAPAMARMTSQIDAVRRKQLTA